MIENYENVLKEAQELAIYIQKKHYPTSTGFELLDSVSGVLSQISNMVAGMERKQEPKFKHIANLWVDKESRYQVDRCDHPMEEIIPVYKKLP
jgi:hypothetical protein